MYRNISYSSYKKQIRLWTWDDFGNRVLQEIPYKPYLFLEQKSGATEKSIFSSPLVKKEFETEFHRKKFVKNSGIKRIFYNLPPEQQFLIDKFHTTTDWMTFTKHPLRIFYLDCEMYSPDEFPEASQAKHPINLITIYDSLVDKYVTWGLKKPFTPKLDNHKYVQCIDEDDLLRTFLRYWRKNFPDILTSWNGDAFDLPYLVNRMEKLFGEGFASRLSPVDNIWSTEKLDRFKNPVTEWHIDGISCIDYMKAYKKFCKNERESWSLDYIANYELKCGKNDLGGMSIASLADNDWEKFVDYNVQDVSLIKDLETSLHYIDLCRMIGYKGLTKFEMALSTTQVVGGAFALEARKRNMYTPTFEYVAGARPAGGLVRIPEPGFKKSIVTFDAASLYPNTMITLNTSPETKIGNVVEHGDNVTIYTERGKEFDLTLEDFNKWMLANKICRSSHGTLFSQEERGIVPAIIENIYIDRKSNKDLMLRLQREISSIDKGTVEYAQTARKIEELDVLQYTLKILMNSMYGTFGTIYSALYDLDIVNSITKTGQELNLKASEAVQLLVKKKYGMTDNLTIGGDTDSIFVGIQPVLDKLGVELMTKSGNLTKKAQRLILELGGEDNPSQGIITLYVSRWGKEVLHSIDPRFEFKREKICDSGLFLEKKKRYVLHVLDDEGVKKDVFKYTGIEVVSSTIAEESKKLIRNVIEDLVVNQDEQRANATIKVAYSKFKQFSPEILGSRKSVRNLKKYQKRASGFDIGKGTPQNSKASLLHNTLINHLKLQQKYEKIKSGDKIKLLYCGKNKFGIDCIAFKNNLPDEFKLQPNYDRLYMQHIHPIFERVFEAVNWDITNPTKQYSCNLLDVFNQGENENENE